MELGIGNGDDVRDNFEIAPRDVRDDTEEYEADTSAGDTVEVGIDPMSASIVEEEIIEQAGEDSSDSSGTRDGIVRSFEDMSIDLDDAVCDFYHHIFEVHIDRIVGIETIQKRLRLYMSLSQEEFCQVRRKRAENSVEDLGVWSLPFTPGGILTREPSELMQAYALSWRELLRLMTEVTTA
ncbi:hypothetical protein Tco_0893611 [Tanacetum coccineum]|uniref:Uncharacterized protein n=1 Tax=Tanacetum coccineum TaxID=301880 RepID=A0ABQ5CAV1_9ASTR